MVLVTGAAGQVGSALVRHLRSAGRDVVASDLGDLSIEGSVPCDLRSDHDVARLFGQGRYSVVVHLAAVLPTAFRSEPLAGGEVNLSGSLRLLRACVDSSVRRFVFGSSASVYGSLRRPGCDETADPRPDDPYASAKLAIERILEAVPSVWQMETVSLRIARVLGPGARRTGSAWRSRMFERPGGAADSLTIPFAPDAMLSVVHVDDLAEMLRILVEAAELPSATYNAPVELLRAKEIGQLATETRGWRVSLGTAGGGPEIDGARFVRDFGFANRPLREHLRAPAA